MSCTRCELSGNVGLEHLNVSIRGDKLHLFYNTNCVFETTEIQISYCPFCGRDLHGEINKQVVGLKIRSIRKTLGLTMKEFGGRLGKPVASDSIVSRWEKGVSIPNNERLKLIAEIGGITVNELLDIKKA